MVESEKDNRLHEDEKINDREEIGVVREPGERERERENEWERTAYISTYA